MTDSRSNLVPVDTAELIEVSGEDAARFLDAQLTSDVATLAPQAWHWSAWLDAQGRVRAFFPLLRPSHDRFLVWLPLGGASRIRDELRRFVLRAKVTVEAIEGWMLGQAGGPAPDAASRRIESREGGWALGFPGAEPRVAWLGPAFAAPDVEARVRWRRSDIAACLPWIAPALQQAFVPQALALDRIDAIRFDKGCYPGQEIASRLHFRGGNKRSLHRIRIEGGEAGAGAAIMDGADAAGTVLYAEAAPDGWRDALGVIADSRTVGGLNINGNRVVVIESI